MGVLRRLELAAVFIAMGLLFSTQVMEVEVAGSEGETKMDKVEAGSKTIVLIGASYAGGWPSEMPVAGYRIVNKGVNGQQSSEMLARFENDVIALKPEAVIIWGFINDVFRSDRSDIDRTLRRTRESILAMMELARKAGITPILATEVTIRGKAGWSEPLEAMFGKFLGKSSYQDYINGHVIETNRWIRDLATREGLLLLDLETVLADRQRIRRKEFSQPDGSHISLEGYDAVRRYSEDRIKISLGSR